MFVIWASCHLKEVVAYERWLVRGEGGGCELYCICITNNYTTAHHLYNLNISIQSQTLSSTKLSFPDI